MRVDSFMNVERYSHVMHIVSNIKGEMTEGTDVIDVVKATFPCGTLSGAPKVRAMEIIEEIETGYARSLRRGGGVYEFFR